MNHVQGALGVNDAADYAGIKRDKIYHAINAGELKSLKIGRRRLIRVQALDEWLQSLEDQLSADQELSNEAA